MIKNIIREAISDVLEKMIDTPFEFEVKNAPPQFGDFASNVALVGSRFFKKSPRQLAEQIAGELCVNPIFDSVSIDGPGFLNFKVSNDVLLRVVRSILNGDYKVSRDENRSVKVQFEYGSANPTGPFTVGHGRQLVIGDVLSRVFKELGFSVIREMYINDAGRQIKLLGRSLWIRYNQQLGVEELQIPQDGYHGEYLVEIAGRLIDLHGERYKNKWDDKIERLFCNFAVENIMAGMRSDLEQLNCQFDVYFSEKSLISDGTVDGVLKELFNKGLTYEKDGAIWLRVSSFVDDADKVLIRSDGSYTYFLTDIAYHYNKYKRGFHRVYDIWGSDHHGHVSRMVAAMKALGIPDDFLNIILHQFVTLKREGETVKMSTRAGSFVPLKNLVQEVGPDAARYFFAMIDPNTHMVFDIDLAKKQSADNPVYYVQYAHARICSLFRQAKEKGLTFEIGKNLDLLQNPLEKRVMKRLDSFDDALNDVVRTLSPNKLCLYLEGLAYDFHSFYTKCLVINPSEPELSNARLSLARATEIVLSKGLSILGISAPERM
ncbi:MAG: arginine--tRNA ligase [Thermotogae bacterium]|nr:MAG: arginine--tRNA ligase [Thermotogota bacterium]